MTKVRQLTVYALVVTSLVLGAVTQARAQTAYPPVPLTRQCLNLPLRTGTVTITAGPNGTGGLDPIFPIQVPCPVGSGTCLKWLYEWRYVGINPTQTYLTAPSGVEIQIGEGNPAVTEPGVADSAFKAGAGIIERRVITYNANGANFMAQYYTPVDKVGGGLITAGASSGSGVTSCAIAGPSFFGSNANPVEPVAAFECVDASTNGDLNGSFLIARLPNSCKADVTLFPNSSTCGGPGTVVTGIDAGTNILYSSTKKVGEDCKKDLLITANSPCQLTTMTTGGKIYKWCYHGGVLINTLNCTQHTGVCATHP